MDLTPFAWLVVGAIAGFLSGYIVGGRNLRGILGSLVIGLIAAGLAGWFMVNIVGSDSVTSIWVSAVIATAAALVLRFILRAFEFGD